ncbi:MAG: hypothetical protein J6P03_08305 [Opitutales bacterium]|nr:hypothetical protein [Opitutales bacterium]
MKKFYKDSELEQMSFHDCSIWGFSFGGRKYENSPYADLIFDIDYIFEWVKNGDKFDFIIAPCTLVFKNAYNLKMNFDTCGFALDAVQILGVKREKTLPGFFKYEISLSYCGEGAAISFEAQEAEMAVRKAPIASASQLLPADLRK